MIETAKASNKQLPGAKRLPPAAGMGRPKGTPNKVTGQVKEMILQALDGAGGVEYLIEKAHDPKTASAFLTLVGKVLPLQISGPGGGPVVFERIVREVVDPK